MYIQKDRYLDILANYKKFNEDSTKIDYSVLPQPKNNKETVNLILNQRTASLKNAPIRNSDKKKAPVIHPYQQFKGAQTLPTFKKDLKAWHIC